MIAGHLTWMSPHAFWLLIPLLAWWWLSRFSWQALPKVRLRHAFIDRMMAQVPSSDALRSLRWLWGGLGILLIMVLARPVWEFPSHEQQIPLTQANGMLVVETSVSLLLTEPDGHSRLAQLQAAVKQLAAQRSAQARTGLVVFADEVYPVLPLTQDMTVLSSMIQRLDAAFAGREDTALLEAVQFAAWQLDEQKSVQPWLLLISDGAHAPSRGQLETVMRWVQQHRIHVHLLLLGSESVPEDHTNAGLLYMPRHHGIAEQLVPWGVSVTLVEDQPAMAALIHELTQPVASEMQWVDQQATTNVDLSSYGLMVALLVWLLMWWREMRYVAH